MQRISGCVTCTLQSSTIIHDCQPLFVSSPGAHARKLWPLEIVFLCINHQNTCLVLEMLQNLCIWHGKESINKWEGKLEGVKGRMWSSRRSIQSKGKSPGNTFSPHNSQLGLVSAHCLGFYGPFASCLCLTFYYSSLLPQPGVFESILKEVVRCLGDMWKYSGKSSQQTVGSKTFTFLV